MLEGKEHVNCETSRLRWGQYASSCLIIVSVSLVFAQTCHADVFVLRPSAGDFEQAIENGVWIRNAVNERILATDGSGMLSTEIGTRLECFSELQDSLQQESMVSKFVDHTEANNGRFDGLDDIPMFTITKWFQVALPGDGFRRVTEWDGTGEPMYLYGQIQDGDIFGPWIAEDLKKAVSTLKWSRKVLSATDPSQIEDKSSYWFAEDDWGRESVADARSYILEHWISGTPPGSWTRYYGVEVSFGQYLPFEEVNGVEIGWHQGFLERAKGLPVLNNVPVFAPCDIDVYFIPEALGYLETDPCPANFPGGFWDIDSIGCQEGKLYYHETMGALVPPVSSRGGVGEATFVRANISDCPLGLTDFLYRVVVMFPDDPSSEWALGGVADGAGFRTSHWVLKWVFEHTLP